MTSEEDRKPEEGTEERGRDRDERTERSERDDRDDRDDDRRDDDRRDDRRDDDRRDDDRRDRADGDRADGKRVGTVARWNVERGFGFITPSGGGTDVFCHITAINDGNSLPEGGEVEYEVSFDDRMGKERAQNVTGGKEINRNGGHAPRDPGGVNGTGKLNGTVARWNGERGFGFISPSTGGEDLFCHTTSITDGNALPEGGKVTFDQEFDDKRGKEHAVNVAGGCEEKKRDDRDRGYDRRDDRGYDRDRRDYYDDRRDDRGYDRGGYDRGGYDRGGYDRRDDRGYDRGYDRRDDRGYDRPRDDYDRRY